MNTNDFEYREETMLHKSRWVVSFIYHHYEEKATL